jgi:hypothetical protein
VAPLRVEQRKALEKRGADKYKKASLINIIDTIWSTLDP